MKWRNLKFEINKKSNLKKYSKYFIPAVAGCYHVLYSNRNLLKSTSNNTSVE